MSLRCSRNSHARLTWKVTWLVPCAHGTPTIKRIGRTPTLVLCSRNARPRKGLVRRLHVDQHGCPSKIERTSKLGRTIEMVKRWSFDVRSWGPSQATPHLER